MGGGGCCHASAQRSDTHRLIPTVMYFARTKPMAVTRTSHQSMVGDGIVVRDYVVERSMG